MTVYKTGLKGLIYLLISLKEDMQDVHLTCWVLPEHFGPIDGTDLSFICPRPNCI